MQFNIQGAFQSSSNQNSMVLAQQQTHRLKGQNETQKKTHNYMVSLFVFNKSGLNIQREKSLFNKCWANWTATYMQKSETEPLSSLYTNISSRWIKDLNVRPETMKVLEESTVISLTLAIVIVFLDISWGMWNKSKNKLLELHQNKNLHSEENNWWN